MMARQKTPSINVIVSGLFGNILEAYDITICGFMAHIIATKFFNASDGLNNLILTFSILFVGYFSRPIGGLVLGWVADQYGRKRTLIFSLLGMGLATSAIGLLPTYSSAGNVATLLLLILRVIQGFAAGGEYTSSIAFLIEHAPPNQRGLAGSWAPLGINFGILIASLVSFVVTYLLSQQLVSPEIWRVPFLITFVGAFLGIWIRYNSPETLPFILENAHEQTPTFKNSYLRLRDIFSERRKDWIIILCLMWLGTCSTYLVFIYGPIHMSTVNNLSTNHAILINTISISLLVILIPLFGYLSDIINRKHILGVATLLFVIFSYPFFFQASYGSFSQILFYECMLAIAASALYSIVPVITVEIMPVKIRCTATALVYAFAATLFGATAPIIALILIKKLGNPASPGYYLLFCSIVAFVSTLFLKNDRQKDVASLELAYRTA